MKVGRIEVRLVFSAGLQPLLQPGARALPVLRRRPGKAAVKDLIESCGVPHTEVDLVILEGAGCLDLCAPVTRDARLQVFGFREGPTAPAAERLLRTGSRRFVADGHLGTTVRRLRLLGIDTVSRPDIDDRTLLEIMAREARVLLTRDRRLLMHRIVEEGYCPRSDDPEVQVREILGRFGFTPESWRPLTRCLACNGDLEAVSKAEVEGELEPLTRRHFAAFRRCARCGRVYWPGSHHPKLQAIISTLSEI